MFPWTTTHPPRKNARKPLLDEYEKALREDPLDEPAPLRTFWIVIAVCVVLSIGLLLYIWPMVEGP